MTRKTKNFFIYARAIPAEVRWREGWTRHLKSDSIEAFSAGIETHGLNPHMVKVMAEGGGLM